MLASMAKKNNESKTFFWESMHRFCDEQAERQKNHFPEFEWNVQFFVLVRKIASVTFT